MGRQSTTATPTWWTDFALAYLENGNDGASAYRTVKPQTSPRSASVLAYRLLRNVNFDTFFRKLQAELAEKIHYSKFEWLNKLTNAARFDPSMLFEQGPDGVPTLRENWKEVCNRHHALRSIKAKKTTWTKRLKNGDEEEEVTTSLSFDAHSSMEANEKLGRILGYDKSAEPVKVKIEDMNLMILQMIEGFNKLPEKSVKQLEDVTDVESLLEAKVVGA